MKLYAYRPTHYVIKPKDCHTKNYGQQTNIIFNKWLIKGIKYYVYNYHNLISCLIDKYMKIVLHLLIYIILFTVKLFLYNFYILSCREVDKVKSKKHTLILLYL